MTLQEYDPTESEDAVRRSANSYASVTAADDYFALRLDSSAWTDLGSTGADLMKKQAALVTAARLLETVQVPLFGSPADDDQILRWPRKPPTGGATAEGTDSQDALDAYEDLPAGLQYKQHANDRYLIPERIKQAQFEQALHMLANEGILLADVQPAYISLGDLSITNPGRIDVVSGIATALIRPYTPSGGGITSIAWGNDGYPISSLIDIDIDVSGVSHASVGR